MMPDVYDSIWAKCPFFISSGRKNIKCEGVVRGCCVSMQFESEDARNLYRKTYCNTDFEKCALHKAANEKYEKEDV